MDDQGRFFCFCCPKLTFTSNTISRVTSVAGALKRSFSVVTMGINITVIRISFTLVNI